FVVADQRPEEVDAPHHAPMGADLIPLHRAAIVHDVSKQNCRQTLPYLVATRRGHTLEAPVSLVFPHLSMDRGNASRAVAPVRSQRPPRYQPKSRLCLTCQLRDSTRISPS